MPVKSAMLLKMLKEEQLDEVRYDRDGNATRRALGPDDEEKLLKLLRDHSFPVRLDYSEQQLFVRCLFAQCVSHPSSMPLRTGHCPEDENDEEAALHYATNHAPGSVATGFG